MPESTEKTQPAQNEIAVLPLLYDLILWFGPKISAYPKKYKYTLGERLTATQLDILEHLIEARFNRSKRSHFLRRANVGIEKLRYLVRLSKDLHCINLKEYEYAARQLLEIGKMVGGWEKYSKERSTGKET